MGKTWLERIEIQNAANGIASVHHRARAKKHLSGFKGKRIDGEYVLQVATSKDGCVHAHPVHRQEQPVGGKPADHGAASTLLTLLDEHLTRLTEQIRRILRCLQRHFFLRNAPHLEW